MMANDSRKRKHRNRGERFDCSEFTPGFITGNLMCDCSNMSMLISALQR